MAKKKPTGAAAPGIPKTEADYIVGPAIPEVGLPPELVKPDLSDPWYRPAKQYIRREQWNRSILQLLNKLPAPAQNEERILRYIGLPGQHHLDLLSMRGICNSKGLRVSYLGFRVGP